LRHELKTFIEAPQDIQNKSPVLNGFAEVGEGVGPALHLAAVVINGEGALGEGAELDVEEHGAGLSVVQELLFKTKPSSPSGDAVRLVDDVQEVGGDGVEDPGDDHAIHARPRWIVEAGGVTENMVLQREPAEDEEEVATPLGVIGGLEVQNNRNQVLDVLDGGGLAVQMSDGRGIGGDGVAVIVVLGVIVAETFPESSSLRFQRVGQRALFLESVGSGADVVLGVGGGFEEVSLR
jgi:hypothetical protein